MASYNIHAGHNFKVPGAGGCFSETQEARNVKNLVISKLRSLGHTVYDCTDEDGATSNQNLANIVAKCNQHKVDLDVSIHFNAFNGSAHGVEVLKYSDRTASAHNGILNKIVSMGYTNRGIKDGTWLYVLKRTNSPAILIECCFCDNAGDAKLYSAEKMATAIVAGITGKNVSGGATSTPSKPATSTSGEMYRIRKTWADAKSQLGAFSNLDNAKKQCPTGYSVFDSKGNVVYTNNAHIQATSLYRVRKSWADAKSQLGAFSNLDNAKKQCLPGYTVFDGDGKAVYSVPANTSTSTSNDKIYRVRKTWSDAKSQIGAFKILDNAKKECDKAGAGYNVFDWTGKLVYSAKVVNTTPEKPIEKPAETPKEDQAEFKDISPLKGLSNEAFIAYIGPIAKKDMKESGILASITIAQAILESAWGQSELSLKANNLFGMKSSLSGNTWDSDWDGTIYAKVSPEDDGNGNITQVRSDFRLYPTPEKSIQDHSDYLCGAKNGSKLRYEGLFGETDPKIAAQIIKNGGYATASDYVTKLCDIIERYDLDVFDYDTPSDIMDSEDELKKISKEMSEIKDSVNIIVSILQKILGFFTKKK